jgi:hypothetical protein
MPECINPTCSYCRTGTIYWKMVCLREEDIRNMEARDTRHQE